MRSVILCLVSSFPGKYFQMLTSYSVGGLQLLLSHRFTSNVRDSSLTDSLEAYTRHRNLVYIGIFATVELAFILVAASYFATADGNTTAGTALKKAGGAFGFLSGLLGWYTLGHLMCQEALFFSFPMGDTSHFFKPRRLNEQRPAPQHEHD